MLDVPFLEQPVDRCGAASAAMVAQYYGRALDQAELDRFALIPALAGTTPELLVEGVERQGWQAEVVRGDTSSLAAYLSSGAPVIVMLGPAGADPRGHFVVATGWDPNRQALRVHSGQSKNRWIKYAGWYPRWEAAGLRLVMIKRP